MYIYRYIGKLVVYVFYVFFFLNLYDIWENIYFFWLLSFDNFIVLKCVLKLFRDKVCVVFSIELVCRCGVYNWYIGFCEYFVVLLSF